MAGWARRRRPKTPSSIAVWHDRKISVVLSGFVALPSRMLPRRGVADGDYTEGLGAIPIEGEPVSIAGVLNQSVQK